MSESELYKELGELTEDEARFRKIFELDKIKTEY